MAEDNGEPGTNDTFQIEIWLGVVDTEYGSPTPCARLAVETAAPDVIVGERLSVLAV